MKYWWITICMMIQNWRVNYQTHKWRRRNKVVGALACVFRNVLHRFCDRNFMIFSKIRYSDDHMCFVLSIHTSIFSKSKKVDEKLKKNERKLQEKKYLR